MVDHFRPWRSKDASKMTPREMQIFDHFVTRTSRWLDLFDPRQHCSIHVSQHAMQDVGLRNAVLALSISHLSLHPGCVGRTDALEYFVAALRHVRNATQHDLYRRSGVFMSTCLIFSTYEMINGSDQEWKVHLRGLRLLQSVRSIDGESQDMKEAVWLAWLSQDLWTAFREKRQVDTSWAPAQDYDHMTPHEIASAPSIFSHRWSRIALHQRGTPASVVVRAERSMQFIWPACWMSGIDICQSSFALYPCLPWLTAFSVRFGFIIPRSVGPQVRHNALVLILVPGVALQLHHAATILLLSHRPDSGGRRDFTGQQATIKACAAAICGLASSLTDDASSIVSSQCLFIGEEISRPQWLLHKLNQPPQLACAWKTHGSAPKSVCCSKTETNARDGRLTHFPMSSRRSGTVRPTVPCHVRALTFATGVEDLSSIRDLDSVA